MKKLIALSALSVLAAQLSAGVDIDPEDWKIVRDAKDPVVTEDTFRAMASGSDTILGPKKFEAFDSAQYPFLRLQLRTGEGRATTSQIFWTTAQEPQISEKNSARVTTKNDGLMHTYLIELSKNPGWKGMVKAIRFDAVAFPKDKPGEFTVGDFEFFGYNDDFEIPGSFWKQVNQVTNVVEDNDTVTGNFITGKNDPYVFAFLPNLPADKYKKISLKLKLEPGAAPLAQLYWFNAETKTFNEKQRADFKVVADGAFHEYTVDVAANPNWTGEIKGLRIDLTANPGSSTGFAFRKVELEN